MIGRIFAGAIVGLSVLICLAPMRVSALEKCQLPLAEGNCTDSIQRWYFNNKTGVCQQFVYKGCNGNANNFNSTDYCYHACNTTPADSTEEPHSYTITDVTKRIKANKATGQQQLAATAGNDTEDETPPNPRSAPGDVTDDRRPSGAVPVPNGRSTSGLAIPATGSGPQPGGSAPGGIVQPTKEPTLIQNRNPPPQQQQQPAGSQPGQSSSSSSASKPKQSPTAPATSAAGGSSPSGTSSDTASSGAASPNRSKRSASGKHRNRHHDENDKEEERDDEETEHEAEEEEEEDSTKRSSVKQRGKSGAKHKKTDDEHSADEPSKKHKKTKGEDHEKESSVQDLVERMQKTATKLEKLAKKKSAKKSSPDVEEHEEKEDEHKNGENETKAEKSESEPAKKQSSAGTKRRAHRRKGRPEAKSSASDRHGKHSEKAGKKKKSSGSVGLKKVKAGGRSKLLDITMVGGEISAVGDRAVKNVKQSSTLAALLKIGLEEGQKAATTAAQDQDDDDDDDDDIEIVGERIRTIILDPTYVFSYTNITAEDMVSLQEMAAQSEISTMQLVEKYADEIVNKSVIKPEVAASAGAQNAPAVSGEMKPASPAAPVQEATEPKQHVKESAPKVTNPTAAAVAGGADNEAEKTDANHQSEDNNLEQRPLDVEGPTDNASAE